MVYLDAKEIDAAFYDAVKTADENVQAKHHKEEVVERKVVGAVNEEGIERVE
jgi:hypothetical protein